MSDDWIRVVPADPTHVPTAGREQALRSALHDLIPSAEDVGVQVAEDVTFIDAGANQDMVRCPDCGVDLDDDWWAAALSKSYAESGFADRSVVVPCCGALSDLNELDYGEWPIAFARWWIDCRNPGTGRLSPAQNRMLADALGHPVTIVYRHI